MGLENSLVASAVAAVGFVERWCGGYGERALDQCVSVDPGSIAVPVSPQGSLAWEGTSGPREPWNVASSTDVNFLFHPPSPKHTPQQWIPVVSRWPTVSSEAVV